MQASTPARRQPASASRHFVPRVLMMVLVLALATASTAQAALDTNANTDDHSINKPVAWWVFAGLTPTALTEKAFELNARPVDIEVTSVTAGVPTMTVRLVENTGAYAIPGASWVWDKTEAQLEAHVNSTQSRLIELVRYDAGGGNIRWIALMVPNSGATARSWGWLPGRTKAEILAWLSANNQRIIDLDSYGSGSARRWNALTVANTGADRKAYDWDVSQTLDQINARLRSFNGRLVKIERQSDGLYAFVQVDNTGSNATAWWHAYGLRSITDMLNFANQMGARPLDVVRYTAGGSTYYDAVFIDNLNANSRPVRSKLFEGFLDANGWPVGITEAFVQRVDTGEVLVNFNGGRRAESASAIKALYLLHAMKRVDAGDPLGSSFTYYDYLTNADYIGHSCPNPTEETTAHDHQTTLAAALTTMMALSDNRMARGVVLRAGGFGPLNATADAAGLSNIVLRHNDGCAYFDPVSHRFSPGTLRNDASAADLARLWAGVQSGALLPVGGTGRREFLDTVPKRPISSDARLVSMVRQEAAALGLPASVADDFISRSRVQTQDGHYDTCLGDPVNTVSCGQKVTIRSTAGLIALPTSAAATATLRYYAFASLMSDVPVPTFDGATVQRYVDTWSDALSEALRPAVRATLQNW